MGWSSATMSGDGVDNRVDRSGASNWEYQTVGFLQGKGCTGTLVGRKLVITAAHCVLNGPNTYVEQRFHAKRKGTSSPYGSQRAVKAWVGGKWEQLGCDSNAISEQCIREDWAVLLLEDSFPQGHPGWLGFAYASDATTRTWTKRNVGYPGCHQEASPANCQAQRLYGQLAAFSIDRFWLPFSDGYNQIFTYDADTSPGHSGGPLYHTSSGSHYVFGVVSTPYCQTCKKSQGHSDIVRAFPNKGKRIDAFIFNLIVNLRALHP